MKRVFLLSMTALMLISATGCNRGSVVKDDKVLEVEPGSVKILYVPACKQFDVTFSTSGNVPVNVSIVSKADGEETEKSDTATIKGKKLASKDNATNDKLSYTANNQPTAVVFESTKKTSVTVKISGE